MEGNPHPITLQRGEIALMARGCDHVLSTEKTTPIETQTLRANVDSKGDNNTSMTVLSGAYELWNDPVHPFFKKLPEWFTLRREDLGTGVDTGIYQLLDLLGHEISEQDPGSDRIIHGILDVIFSLIIRRVLKESSDHEYAWFKDNEVRGAIELLHQDIRRTWKLDELARAVGVSRSSLAHRFRQVTGDSPLHYLSTLRIQKAMNLLTSTDLNIEQVAAEIGFTDPFTFSKSFKKTTGLAPRTYRKRAAQVE